MRLPSYDFSRYPTTTESRLACVLQLLGPYLSKVQLWNLCLVSKLCRALFQPLLWRDPLNLLYDGTSRNEALHQPTSSEVERQVFDLYRLLQFIPFRRSANTPRFPTQYVKILRLYHESTIDLGSCCVNRPKDYLHSLTDLKVLIYEKLTSSSLHRDSLIPFDRHDGHRYSPVPELYVLSAPYLRSCPTDLKNLLKSCRTLLYIDLSYMARGESLSDLIGSHCSNIAILKLAGSLKKVDDSRSFWRKLVAQPFSLDISNNYLTDEVLYMLCGRFAKRDIAQRIETNDISDKYIVPAPRYTRHDEWGLDGERLGPSGSDWLPDDNYNGEVVGYRDDSLNGVLQFLTRNGYLDSINSSISEELLSHSRQAVQAQPALNSILSARSGVTHLHIGGNSFSEGALQDCLSHKGLQYLDFGMGRYSSHCTPGGVVWHIRTCGFILAEALPNMGLARLEHLRIHHSFVTFVGRASSGNNTSPTRTSILIQEQRMTFPIARKFKVDDYPSLRTLVLVDVPHQSYGAVTERLQDLLQQAAKQEELIVKLRTKLGSTSRRGPQLWSGLRVLRLEMETWTLDLHADSSITEDKDADAFHRQSANDFSFFSGSTGSDPIVEDIDEAMDDLRLLDVLTELRRIRQDLTPRWQGKIEIVGTKRG